MTLQETVIPMRRCAYKAHDVPVTEFSDRGYCKACQAEYVWRRRHPGQPLSARKLRRPMALACLLLLFAASSFADEPTPLWLKGHEAIPSRISDALVGLNVARDVWTARHDRPELGRIGCAHALTFVMTSALQAWIPRERPNGRDFKSMPSKHVAHARASVFDGWGVAITVGTGWGRGAGGWHHVSDLLAGALVGDLARKVCR